MFKAVAKIVILFLFATVLPNLFAKIPAADSDNTFFAQIMIDLSALHELCTVQARCLLEVENKLKQKRINNQINSLFNLADFDIKPLLNIVQDSDKLSFFIPSGKGYLAFNSNYEPFMLVKAKVKPVEFYEYIFQLLKRPEELKAYKKSPEIVEIRIPLEKFNLIFKIYPDGLKLYPEKEQKICNQIAAENSEGLIDFKLDFNQVKQLLAERSIANQQSICFANLIKINDALGMYLINHGKTMNKLDLRLLKKHRIIAALPICPAGGIYSLDLSNKNLSVCSVHGSIKKPAPLAQSLELLVDPRLEVFKAFEFLIKSDVINFKIGFNDTAVLQQWQAIARQQILTLKYVILNKLSHLSNEEKAFIIKKIEAINCEIREDHLCISVDDINETFLATALIAASGRLAQAMIPRYQRKLKLARAGKCLANRRKLKMAIEMFIVDNPKENVTLESLIKMEYLKKLPLCPENGQYDVIEGDKVKCSIHGF